MCGLGLKTKQTKMNQMINHKILLMILIMIMRMKIMKITIVGINQLRKIYLTVKLKVYKRRMRILEIESKEVLVIWMERRHILKQIYC